MGSYHEAAIEVNGVVTWHGVDITDFLEAGFSFRYDYTTRQRYQAVVDDVEFYSAPTLQGLLDIIESSYQYEVDSYFTEEG